MIYHGDRGLGDLTDVVKTSINNLTMVRDRFDSIAVQGVSGMIVGAPVAVALDIPLVVVRKSSENHHYHPSANVVNACNVGQRVLFIDDFIADGETERAVRDAVARNGSQVVGSYLYSPHVWRKANGGPRDDRRFLRCCHEVNAHKKLGWCKEDYYCKKTVFE